jgi:hypothetical protein
LRGNRIIASVTPLLADRASLFPLDAIPTADGKNVAFTVKGEGVFQVPTGGGTALPLATGLPFVAPRGIELSTNNQTIYVADPQASAPVGTGEIFAIPAEGGAPRAIAGAEGTSPRGLAVAVENGEDVLYYTGRDPQDSQPAVFRLPTASTGTRTVVAKGLPLVAPDGLTVSTAGRLYLTDNAAAGAGCGKVFQIAQGQVTTLVEAAHLGAPGGIALTVDETLLLISAERSTPGRNDDVLIVSLSTLQQTSATKGIGQNHADAGGLHRARGSNVFAWADIGRNRGGAPSVGTTQEASATVIPGQVYLVTAG